MKILEYGNTRNEKIILIHGFESPYEIWEDYIEYYKQDYCIIVPILTGHNINDDEDFISFDKCASELEDYYIQKHGNKVFAIYGMSMGGILACYIWKNKKIEINKLILESSPLLSYGKIMTYLLTKQYLTITHKAQIRDKKVIKQAVGSMVTQEKLDIFMKLLDHISDTTIINYIRESGKFKLLNNIDTPNTEIYYLYGGKINEILCRKVAKFLKKNYSNANIICFSDKGHCENALINPQKHIKVLNQILK